jgi:membrane carboxypeptidase/penicillin-binding protein
MTSRWWFYPALIAFSLALVAAGVAALTVVLLWPNLPSLEVLTDYRPKIPLRVYSAEGELIGEFGEEKRALIKIQDVPQVVKAAILAAEDDRFYQHGGVDYVGMARAAVANLHGRREGASTITMQVARTFFLTREKTLARKLSEVLLAFKIEANLTKDQILELYLNQIFLGQRAYGFQSASNVYFGKNLADVTPAQAAMLAGLPQAPSRQNPFVNLKRAQERQQYVLRRMHEVGWLSTENYKKAVAEPLRLNPNQRDSFAFRADYVAEMARAAIVEQYGESAYVSGLRVYTTVRRKDQEAANASLRLGILEYDTRHGYRGPEGYASLPAAGEKVEDAVEEALLDREVLSELVPAVVTEASPREVKAALRRGDVVSITGDGLRFATRALAERKPRPGDPAGGHHPPAIRRQGRLEHPPAAQGRGGIRGARSGQRRDPRPRRRVRLQCQQVQPRDPGLAPAGVELQAVHLLGRARKGLHPGDGSERRPVRDRSGEDRRAAVGAEELRRQVRGADAVADGARQVQEHGVDTPAAGDRAALRPGLHPALRLRSEDAPGLPHHGPGRGLLHAAADGRRVLDLRQRGLPR